MAFIRKKINLSTKYGVFQCCTFKGLSDDKEHIALVFKNAEEQSTPLVRIHSECITGDLFGSNLCDCGDQLEESIKRFHQEGGVLLYLRQEGRGIGLYNKIDAYAMQRQGYDTFEANQLLSLPEDNRNYSVAAEMLKALGLQRIILLSNNPDKQKQLQQQGVKVTARYSTGFYLKKENSRYLEAKIQKSGHCYQSELIEIMGVYA